MEILTAKVRAQVWGKKNTWSLSPDSEGRWPSQECDIELQIIGDGGSGHILVISPTGFFTADHWYKTKEDALRDAEKVFGIRSDEWTSKRNTNEELGIS